MKNAIFPALVAALVVLAGCSGTTQTALPSAQASSFVDGARARTSSSGLAELFNLDYSNGTITVYSIQGNKAKVTTKFAPGSGIAQGLAADAHGRIYTTVTSSGSSPCAACVQVYSDAGKLMRQLDAPTLQGGSGPPDLTDVSVDAHENVYVSDYGQKAVYFFPRGRTKKTPTVVVQNSNNAASVLATPNGETVFISGGCGFASVAPFTRGSSGYTQGSCFGIGTIALIGGATDNQEDVITPVDGAPGLVSVSSPSGGGSFNVPDPLGSISGIALNSDGSIAYVADAHKKCVYAFARPAKGWLAKGQPKLLTTYKGFKNLDVIAVPQ
jgi:hypothetical protein